MLFAALASVDVRSSREAKAMAQGLPLLWGGEMVVWSKRWVVWCCDEGRLGRGTSERSQPYRIHWQEVLTCEQGFECNGFGMVRDEGLEAGFGGGVIGVVEVGVEVGTSVCRGAWGEGRLGLPILEGDFKLGLVGDGDILRRGEEGVGVGSVDGGGELGELRLGKLSEKGEDVVCGACGSSKISDRGNNSGSAETKPSKPECKRGLFFGHIKSGGEGLGGAYLLFVSGEQDTAIEEYTKQPFVKS